VTAEAIAKALGGRKAGGSLMALCAAQGDIAQETSGAGRRASANARGAQVTHRDAPVTCRACGKRVPRKGRSQAYCSRRCRQRAYWDRKAIAKISATVTHDTGRSTTPHKLPNNINVLGGRKWRPTDFGKAPLNLLGGGLWRWSEAPPLTPLIRTKIIAAEIGELPAASERDQ
jgi:endogenous inhibitor of DNA gyrase (YacG/DUF329 family)